MVERSRFWNGTTTGDATEAPYDAPTEHAQVLMAVSRTAGHANKGGVIRSVLSDLLPTSPSANTLRVAPGQAIVYGTWYENDANVDTAIATPAGATRIDRIVLRKSWAAQTVRVTRIAGAEGGAAPAMTQIVGTTWDFPIASVSITTGGVITVTDDRSFMGQIIRNIFIPVPFKAYGTVPVNDGTYGIQVHKLASTGTGTVFFQFGIPDDYVPGTLINLVVRWWMESAVAGNVVTNIVAIANRVGSAPSVASLLSATQTEAVSAVADRIEDSAAVTTSAPLVADLITAIFSRLGDDAVNTITGDMNVIATAEMRYYAYV